MLFLCFGNFSTFYARAILDLMHLEVPFNANDLPMGKNNDLSKQPGQ